MQSGSWYGDIRLSIAIPRRRDARRFTDFTDGELLALAEAQGFAGQLKVTPRMCARRRDLDYQPRGPIPDEGTWAIEGDVLTEGGIHVEYEEIWRLEPGRRGLRAAFGQAEGRGLLILAGDHFLQIEARAAPLPDGGSLPALVGAALTAGALVLAQLGAIAARADRLFPEHVLRPGRLRAGVQPGWGARWAWPRCAWRLGPGHGPGRSWDRRWRARSWGAPRLGGPAPGRGRAGAAAGRCELARAVNLPYLAPFAALRGAFTKRVA